MDLAREFALQKCATSFPQVSILVLMDLARESDFSRFAAFFAEEIVSILVLMDLAREYMKTRTRAGARHHSFNPCFNGSCSRIHAFPHASGYPHMVSILVLMDLARE